jgi:hypothetical protein
MVRILMALLAFTALGFAQNERALLSNPRALAGEPGRATRQELLGRFNDPPAEYRSMPLWVWNDQLEWPRLREQLAQFKQQGMGGVFVHPRPGLMTEYLGKDWFHLWKASIEEGKRLGLLVNIYDENSYPSGFSGGHVPAMAPDTAAQYVQADMDANPDSIRQRRGTTVSFFAVEKNAAGQIVAAKRVHGATDIPKGHSLVIFRLRRASGNPWTGEFPYVDLTNPQTTPAFLQTTYEPYKQHIGSEFGKTVKWAFTDEPLIATGGAYDNSPLSLPLSYNTLAEFHKRNGYDLADHLASLYWDVGDFRKVRFDYWQTVHDLWKENFMRPMFEWCDRNNIQFTGHWMEHEWPYPWITPADANLYAFQHTPGIDLLEGTNLRLKGNDPHLLFTIKQVASVAHQLGRRAFCEAFGVAGWDGTLEHYKRFGDWLMVHGINFMNQHLSFATIRGARKRDHPQSFSDVSPWWPYYKIHGDHMGRVSYASSRSEARNRLLVLQQTTSGFLLARRGGATPELESVRENNAAMNQFLADHQVDFDLGDEYMIEWFGGLDGRRFSIGKAKYDLLVWPPDMTNVRAETIPYLERYLAAGGEILALSPPAEFVNGRLDGRLKELAHRHQRQWRQVQDLRALLAAVRERLKPRIAFDGEMPDVGFLERYLAGGDRVLFLANTGLRQAKARATVEGGSVETLDTVTGKTATPAQRAEGDRVSFDVDLAPAASLMLIVKKEQSTSQPPRELRFTRLDAGPWRIAGDAPNTLVLDYCDLRAAGESQKGVNTWQANWTAWERHGFERPAWDNAVQFKTRIFDRNTFPKESGFVAGFRFDITDKAAIPGLELALETPELYRISVNGKPVDFKAGTRWMDPHLVSVSIERLAQVGENVVVVEAAPFDVRMELENIYVRGRFAMDPIEKGFVLKAPRSLDFGSWARQGYPFYGGAVTYQTDVTVPAGATHIRVELERWQGSVAAVLLDSRPAATIAWQPFRADLAVSPGTHTVGVRIVSTPRNTLGPFHNPTKPRMRAWPAAWADFPDQQPPGASYDLLDYGLMAPPVISTGS